MSSSYPNLIDSAATLYSPVDAFSTRPLETTATQQILAGDTTISVASTDGFAASYGILSIDDELIVYTSKTAMQFTGCQRGAFGTTAAQHAQGVAVKANMVSAFITALQSAVTAIENELGTVAARNYVRRDGAVTITGVKTFVDGAEFGSGAKAATGLVRLPNAGAIKWRKADNSGDLGMALNANDHVAFDAIIDFAPGQTFGAFSYPDATTTSKGIVQVDPVGGLVVSAGVLSLAGTGVAPGTYTKTTVDAKGRITAGAALAAGDLPAHTHVTAEVTDATSSNIANSAVKRDANGSFTAGLVKTAGLDGGFTLSGGDARVAFTGVLFPRKPDLGAVLMQDYQDEFALAHLRRGAVTTITPVPDFGVANYLYCDDANSVQWNTGTSPFPVVIEVDCSSNPVLAAGNGTYNVAITFRSSGVNPTGIKIEVWDAAAGAYTTKVDQASLTTLSGSGYAVWISPSFLAPASSYNVVKLRVTISGTNPLPGYFRVQRLMLYHGSSQWDRWHLRRDGGTVYGNLGITGALTLSASGPGFLKQTGAGAAVTVAPLAAGDLPAHTHASADVSDATASATASTVVRRDADGGASFAYAAANTLWAYEDSHLRSIECGPFGTVGGPYENMAKYSEDFSVATWDKNGGSCSVSANATAAPDGNMTADQVTAVTATPIIQQQIAGLVSGGQYTFYIWARVESGTRKVSIAIVDNPYAAYLAGPMQITLTTSW